MNQNLSTMDYNAYIDLNTLSEEAKNELIQYYEYLVFKYKEYSKKKLNQNSKKKKFSAVYIDTTGFKFNREEANAR